MKHLFGRYSTTSVLRVATVSMLMIGVGAAAAAVSSTVQLSPQAESSMAPAIRSAPGNTGKLEVRLDREPLGDQWQRDLEIRQQVDPFRNGPRADDASPADEVGFFYDQLSPHGEWVQHPDYGWVWFPRDVGPSWRPYTLGRWVFTDQGWTWVSAEPFGWATYHYGRWLADPQIGWVWVPGTDWGPAWVAWQETRGFIGWAPLPPSVGFEREVGLQTDGLDMDLGISPLDYSFVDERRFLSSRIEGYLLPVERNFAIMRLGASATSYMVVDHRVVNRGVPIETVERVTGKRPPTRFRIAMAAEPEAARVHGDVVSVFQPRASDLQTVRVATRNNAGLRPREHLPPTLSGVGMPVALRTGPAGAENDRQFQREQNELKSSQAREQNALEAIHHGEMAQWQLRVETQTTSKREAVEAQALRDQHRGAEQQLQTRQQIRLQAARASAATNEQKRNPVSPASTIPTDPGR